MTLCSRLTAPADDHMLRRPDACGHGIAQLMELGTRELVRSGTLVELFPRWRHELFPLYVFHPSRHLPAAKVRAFVDFVIESARDAR